MVLNYEAVNYCYSRVSCFMFFSYKAMYYLSYSLYNTPSHKLVLKCIDEMLKP